MGDSEAPIEARTRLETTLERVLGLSLALVLEEAISVGFNRVEGSSQMCTNGSVMVVIESNARIKPGFNGKKEVLEMLTGKLWL